MGETEGDGRWMTYRELAVARGIEKSTAMRLARRRRWEHRPGNDGTARVLVPDGEDHPVERRSAPRRADGADPTSIFTTALAAIREDHARELDRLTVQLTDAEAKVEALRQAEAAWWRMGLWHRLWSAWRGGHGQG
jgi:hypothetical protein